MFSSLKLKRTFLSIRIPFQKYLKMNFIQRKKNSSFLVPSYPSLSFHRYKSFLTRFSLGCAHVFRTKIRRIIQRGGGSWGHRSLDNGLLIRSIHLPQILSSRFIRPHHVYHVPFFIARESYDHRAIHLSHVLIAQRPTVNWALCTKYIHKRFSPRERRKSTINTRNIYFSFRTNFYLHIESIGKLLYVSIFNA